VDVDSPLLESPPLGVLAGFGFPVVRDDLGTLRQCLSPPELFEVKKLFERPRRIPTTDPRT
jgi:hypothetical protein